MDRRDFIISSTFMLLFFNTRSELLSADEQNNRHKTFDLIIERALSEDWHYLPINEIMAETAQMLLGKPYVAGTLETNIEEQCVVNLNQLDCVTFFENVLDIARIIKLQKYKFEDLIEQITYTRYRQGRIDGYTSRLHYTSDWIYDNVKKGVVRDISKILGGKRIRFNLSFMSNNPKYYKQLKDNPAAVNKMKLIETEINQRQYYYIPRNNIKSIEDKLENGDIIAVVNTHKGLDYSHTGLIYKQCDSAYFMHASSLKKKVVIDKTISQYLAGSKKSNIGISIMRPLEPQNAE